MINKDKFLSIARVYTKEYMGIEEYGKDIEYEDELTNAFADYLVSIFVNRDNLCTNKETLLNIMSQRDIKYKSNIIKGGLI